MASIRRSLYCFLALGVSPAIAQGLLSNDASQACGGTDSNSQSVWDCFCQSAYLKDKYAADNGICSSTCAVASDSRQVVTWYKSNCGTDDSTLDHAAAAATTTPATSLSSSSAGAAAAQTSTASAGSTNTGSSTSDDEIDGTINPTNNDPDWWPNHWRWVVAIIVIFVGFGLVTLVSVLARSRLRRRRELRPDRFNTGITMHNSSAHMHSCAVPVMGDINPGSGQNSPVRTRDAFMPYGYAYTRSDSRIVSRTDITARGSPLARGVTAQTSPISAPDSEKHEIPASKGGNSMHGVIVLEHSAENPPPASDGEQAQEKQRE